MSINSIGDRIKALRKEQKLTLKDLSEKANISVSFLSDIENSRSKPSLERLNDIAIALDTTTSYLMGENASTETVYLTKKDEKDIEKATEKFLEGLEGGAMLNGEILDDEDFELFKQAVKNGLTYAKISNKKKYTPKKYRKNND